MREPASLDAWLAALRGQGWQGKNVSKEWVGPCPLCGGDDRFHLKKGDKASVLAGCRKGCQFKDIAEKVLGDTTRVDRLDPPDWGPTSYKDEKVRAMDQLSERWDNAQAPSDVHPYFAEKGYDANPEGVRVERDKETLLVPMRALGIEGNPLHGLHRIWWDRKRWVKKHAHGSKSNGSCFAIEPQRLKETRRVYVVEGIATGLAVSQAVAGTDIEGVVIVAFVRGNLGHIAKALKKKHPDTRRILCADNDRWKNSGENPGVEAAKAAAREHDAEICIPDFKDWTTRPTDFDDLRTLEGDEAVRHWLDPTRAPKAVTTAPRLEANGTEGALPPPEEDPDPCHGLRRELVELAYQVGEEGWTHDNCETLAELRTAARELDIEGPPPPVIEGKSASDALAALEAHFKEHAPPEPDSCFEDNGTPQGLVVAGEWDTVPGDRQWVVSRPWGPAGSVVLFTARGAGGEDATRDAVRHSGRGWQVRDHPGRLRRFPSSAGGPRRWPHRRCSGLGTNRRRRTQDLPWDRLLRWSGCGGGWGPPPLRLRPGSRVWSVVGTVRGRLGARLDQGQTNVPGRTAVRMAEQHRGPGIARARSPSFRLCER